MMKTTLLYYDRHIMILSSLMPPSAAACGDFSPSPGLADMRRVRQPPLERIAADRSHEHITVHAGQEGWQPFLDGIRMKVLHEDGNTLSYLLRLAPGAILPAHRHVQDEECMVLQGDLRCGHDLVVRAGDYHRAREGVPHGQITTDHGALVFIRGEAPEGSQFI